MTVQGETTHKGGEPAESSSIGISQREQQEIKAIYEKLREAEAKLVGPDGKTEFLPNNVYSFLLRLLADLKAGNSVTILQSMHRLTTVEAAKVLGVSRQYLIQLLDKKELPFHMVGTHRRIYVRDVLAYKARRDAQRRTTLNELAKQEFAAGDYGTVPNDFHSGK
jgi:excisionase family DNA binding protein